LREGVLAVTVAEWTQDIALVLSGVTGFFQLGWWYPVVLGAFAALVREASQGFALVQHCGSGYLIPAGWLPDSGQKAETTGTRTPDLEAPTAQSGLPF